MSRIEVPVLIVGAGPVGLMGSLLLARLGMETRILDRRETPIRAPAAHVVNARTFEICRAVGVDMDALAEFVGARRVGYAGPQAYIDALETFQKETGFNE